jgi:hypothetical protein
MIQDFCATAHEDLNIRTDNWSLGLSDNETREVISALLARQVTMATHFSKCPEIWNPHISPIFCRCMADVFINTKWILADPGARSRKFIEYGLGQEKLALEKYEAQIASEEQSGKEIPDSIHRMIETRSQLLENQKYRFLIPVNVGQWSSMDTRKMADEVGEKKFYDYVYAQFSAAVHSTWHHISCFNLARCQNPIHGGHSVPVCPESPPYLDELLNVIKYLCKVFAAFDDAYPFEGSPDPFRAYDQVIEWMDRYGDELASDDE